MKAYNPLLTQLSWGSLPADLRGEIWEMIVKKDGSKGEFAFINIDNPDDDMYARHFNVHQRHALERELNA
jgi:hypothetical protein